jgi:hypothetical protein
VLGQSGWREWPPASLGGDERDLVARVGDSIRLQVLHTVDYRRALANPGSADERRHGRDLSRAIARDAPVARDLASNLLDTVDRLSSARDPSTVAASPVAGGSESPPGTSPLPPPSPPSPSPLPSSPLPLAPAPKHAAP